MKAATSLDIGLLSTTPEGIEPRNPEANVSKMRKAARVLTSLPCRICGIAMFFAFIGIYCFITLVIQPHIDKGIRHVSLILLFLTNVQNFKICYHEFKVALMKEIRNTNLIQSFDKGNYKWHFMKMQYPFIRKRTASCLFTKYIVICKDLFQTPPATRNFGIFNVISVALRRTIESSYKIVQLKSFYSDVVGGR